MKLWVSRSSSIANDSHRPGACPVLPPHHPLLPRPPHLCPGREMESEMNAWDELKGEWRGPPPQNNDNHRDLATVPQRPLDTQPHGLQVSWAHYTSSLHLNSLPPHLHTRSSFFVSYFSFFPSRFSSFPPQFFPSLNLIFFSYFRRTPPSLLFVFCISFEQSRYCVCMCVCAP